MERNSYEPAKQRGSAGLGKDTRRRRTLNPNIYAGRGQAVLHAQKLEQGNKTRVSTKSY